MTTTNSISLTTLSAIAILLIGCAAPAPPAPAAPEAVDMEAMTKTVQAMEDAYAVASINNDAASVMNYYADDVISYVRDKSPVVGKKANQERLAEGMAKDTLNLQPTYTVLELFVGDTHMTEIGSWVDKDASGTVKDEGTYFSIFEKSGDEWKCIRDISVSHTPKKEEE